MPDRTEYNPDSLDAVLARFESKFDAHVSNTEIYHRDMKTSVESINSRVSELEGDKKKLLGIAIGSGIGAGGLVHVISKFFGA